MQFIQNCHNELMNHNGTGLIKICRHISSIIKLVTASFHQSVSHNWKHRIEDGLNFDHLEQPVSEEQPVVPGQTAPQAEVASVSWFGNGPTQAN